MHRTGFDPLHSDASIVPYIGNRNGHSNWYFGGHIETVVHHCKTESSSRKNAGEKLSSSYFGTLAH